MLQYAGNGGAAGFQLGAFKVTADTGSPIDATGIEAPSFAEAQSASVSIEGDSCPHSSAVPAESMHAIAKLLVVSVMV